MTELTLKYNLDELYAAVAKHVTETTIWTVEVVDGREGILGLYANAAASMEIGYAFGEVMTAKGYTIWAEMRELLPTQRQPYGDAVLFYTEIA